MSSSTIRARARAATKAAIAAAIFGCSIGAHAGVDVAGVVDEIQIAPNGTLWFGLTGATFGNAGTATPTLATYCSTVWMDLSLYVPANDPNYAYYYGLLGMSLSKSLRIQLGNISTFSGGTSCDITKTGYGIVLLKS